MRFDYRHADGGLYSYQGPQSGKHPTTGEWVEGVCYVSMEDRKPRWTDLKRWKERFTELPVQDIVIEKHSLRDEEEQVTVAEFTFKLEDAGDVRHMLISAANYAGTKGRNSDVEHWLRTVLLAQAEMVTKGLHIRDHDFPDLLGDVNAFHAKFGQEYTGKPRMLPDDLHDFRVKFHAEETEEYRDERLELTQAIKNQDRRDILTSLEKQLDGLCDSVWVLLGTADLQFGRKVFFEAWKRVVAANMKKVRVEVKDDGERNCAETGREAKFDIGKPAGWVAPDHRDLLQDNAVFDQLFGVIPVESEVESNTFNQDAGSYSDTRPV